MQRTKIEWLNGGYTWNPVTGCLHGCPYCYARSISRRFGGDFTMARANPHGHLELFEKPDNPYPDKFDPTFHRYRLGEPTKIKQPQNVFVCSMADLFGEWIPDGWIEAVFRAGFNALQHRYLYLTKNPQRYIDLAKTGYLPVGHNSWFGTTITTPTDRIFFSENHSCFLSIEPIQEPFNNSDDVPEFIKWVIIGAETGNRKGKIIPKRDWIGAIVETCRENNVPVFLKNNLADVWRDKLIQEFPW